MQTSNNGPIRFSINDDDNDELKLNSEKKTPNVLVSYYDDDDEK